MRKNQERRDYDQGSDYHAGTPGENRWQQTDATGNKKLYRVPEEGMVKGVCAGLAHYLGVPVLLIRVIAVLSVFFGLFAFTVVAYIVLTFTLDEAPASSYQEAQSATPRQLLDQLTYQLGSGEQQLRQIERYVTSDTFGVQSRFRKL